MFVKCTAVFHQAESNETSLNDFIKSKTNCANKILYLK